MSPEVARVWDPKRVLRFSLDFVTDLPAGFTWRQWRFDHRDAGLGATDNRLVLISEGTEANLPLGTDLTAQGVGCIQITPS